MISGQDKGTKTNHKEPVRRHIHNFLTPVPTIKDHWKIDLWKIHQKPSGTQFTKGKGCRGNILKCLHSPTPLHGDAVLSSIPVVGLTQNYKPNYASYPTISWKEMLNNYRSICYLPQILYNFYLYQKCIYNENILLTQVKEMISNNLYHDISSTPVINIRFQLPQNIPLTVNNPIKAIEEEQIYVTLPIAFIGIAMNRPEDVLNIMQPSVLDLDTVQLENGIFKGSTENSLNVLKLEPALTLSPINIVVPTNTLNSKQKISHNSTEIHQSFSNETKETSPDNFQQSINNTNSVENITINHNTQVLSTESNTIADENKTSKQLPSTSHPLSSFIISQTNKLTEIQFNTERTNAPDAKNNEDFQTPETLDILSTLPPDTDGITSNRNDDDFVESKHSTNFNNNWDEKSRSEQTTAVYDQEITTHVNEHDFSDVPRAITGSNLYNPTLSDKTLHTFFYSALDFLNKKKQYNISLIKEEVNSTTVAENEIPFESSTYEIVTHVQEPYSSSDEPHTSFSDDIPFDTSSTTNGLDDKYEFASVHDIDTQGIPSTTETVQEGVLKFTLELESKSENSPLENDEDSTPASVVILLQNYTRYVPYDFTYSDQIKLSSTKEVLKEQKPEVRNKRSFDVINFTNPLEKQVFGDLSNNNTILKHLTNVSHFEMVQGYNITSGDSENLDDLETSPSVYASTILELLPVIREGYKNNAFSEEDKKTILSIFGDIKMLIDEEASLTTRESAVDVNSRFEEVIEDSDYDTSETSEDLLSDKERRLKRSKKNFQLVDGLVSKVTRNTKRQFKITQSQNARKIRSPSSPQVSEAAAILALLNENNEAVQLNPPDDEEDDDEYEYYEEPDDEDYSEEGSKEYDDEEAYDDDDEEPSFTELIKLARKHRKRKAKQQ